MVICSVRVRTPLIYVFGDTFVGNADSVEIGVWWHARRGDIYLVMRSVRMRTMRKLMFGDIF